MDEGENSRSGKAGVAAVAAGIGLLGGMLVGSFFPADEKAVQTASAPPPATVTHTAPAPPPITVAPPANPADGFPTDDELAAADDTMTVSQESAVSSAESYLRLGGFSRSGLIEQLQYEEYSKADAEFAVDHIDVDWREQAAESAASYMDISSFSRGGLIDQLEYEGFTSEQANHGADSVGL